MCIVYFKLLQKMGNASTELNVNVHYIIKYIALKIIISLLTILFFWCICWALVIIKSCYTKSIKY